MSNAPHSSPSDVSQSPVESVIDELEHLSEADQLTVRDLTEDFGLASFPTLMMVVGLMLVSPLSGIPLFSSLCGLLIALIASQAALGRTVIWFPQRLLNAKLDLTRFGKGVHAMRRAAHWLDARTAKRLAVLVSQPVSRVVYGACTFAGLCLPLMEVLPFTSSLIGAAVALISVGLLAKDGIFAAVGLIAIPIILSIPIFALSSLLGAAGS